MFGFVEPVGAVLVQHHLVVPVRVADWMKVILADYCRKVAGFGERARLFERISRSHRRHAEHPVMPGRQAGQQSGACRSTTRNRRVGITKADTLLREAV